MITLAVVTGLIALFCGLLVGPRSTFAFAAVSIAALCMRFLP